ncbi:hypothetical protein Back11_06700 [Paenibacillus baekrokdamisoli]|uniref:Uncharacterized protein n=2 Tax=Paenibacillus baekrokdamisoli TaxID=1712516 RepID=A0A3G9ITE5_9BACL|nr:proteasome lid subunit RPN8/RPN11 [Paenibacillus baekrokdamisoli]BBH19325.1 hypothetical protein Back11_06700 [Paenibacillus baekrokdamisoli]
MPNEACGVLTCSHSSEMINQRQNGILSVDQIYPISNTAEHANQNFRFDPNDWITILYRIQKNRQSLVGIYHSHPSTNPLPSLADLEGMQYVPAVSYWIVSFPHLEQPDVQPYWYNRKTFTPLMLAKIGV